MFGVRSYWLPWLFLSNRMYLNRKSSSLLTQRQVSQHQDATSPHFKDTCWELESAIDCIKAWTTVHISPNKSCSWWVNTLYSWHLNSPYLPLILTYTILQVKSISLIKIDLNEKLDHIIWSESNQFLKQPLWQNIYIDFVFYWALWMSEHMHSEHLQAVNTHGKTISWLLCGLSDYNSLPSPPGERISHGSIFILSTLQSFLHNFQIPSISMKNGKDWKMTSLSSFWL